MAVCSTTHIFCPSENAIHELGAAGVLYDSRIIILKESSVNLPSNFREVGYISFEHDQLPAKAIEIFRELISFGLLKVSVA